MIYKNDKKMKKAYSILMLIGVLFLSACNTINDANFPPIEDRYFGQKPPGLIPELFDPKIVSPEGLFEGGTFSPDMKEYYFSRNNGKYKKRTFFVIRYENGTWGNESETHIENPRFSRDGNIIYKGNRYRERTDTGWSELKDIGPPFTEIHTIGMSVSDISDKGTFFFGQHDRNDTIGAIGYSRLINRKYEPLQKMSKEVHSGAWIAHPKVAPDESFLLWTQEAENGYGENDLYISFRGKNGSWLPETNMGSKINTEISDSGMSLSPDEKYLFFSRVELKVKEDGSRYWKGTPYWVSAEIIEELKPKE